MLNLDTNVVVAFLEGTLRGDERRALERDERRAISAIVLWEIEKLFRRRRITYHMEHEAVRGLLTDVTILPITVEIARTSQRLDFEADPADEIIAATSLVHRAPLLTRDSRMLASALVPLAIQ
ncbi:MAG: PIN domain-containing protein [Dehalococcoidia bacterium]|nr:PIN domain-containing protein [Dehalococcoidia bacterium]